MKKSSIDMSKLTQVFIRYSSIIYLVFISVCVSIAILFSISLFGTSDNGTDTSVSPVSTAFDETTIESLKKDSSNSEKASVELPSGRINPFSE